MYISVTSKLLTAQKARPTGAWLMHLFCPGELIHSRIHIFSMFSVSPSHQSIIWCLTGSGKPFLCSVGSPLHVVCHVRRATADQSQGPRVQQIGLGGAVGWLTSTVCNNEAMTLSVVFLGNRVKTCELYCLRACIISSVAFFFFFFSIDLPVSEGFTELEARFPGKSFISERKHYHHVKPHQEVNMVIFLEEHDTSRLWSNSGRQVLTRSLGVGMEFDCLHAPLNFRRLSYVRPEMPGIFLWSWYFSWSKLAAPTKFFSCFFSCLVFFFFFK